MTSKSPLIRFAHPMAFQKYLRHVGAPVGQYLRHNKLPTMCEEPDVFVPVIRVWAFFDEASREESGLLGHRVGKFVGDHALNANLLNRLEKAPTLLRGLRELIRAVREEGSEIDIGIVEQREDILLYTHYWGMRDVPGYHVSQAYQVGVFVDLIRFFLGKDWNPNLIGLETAKNLPGLQQLYPDTRILPSQPLGYVSIPRRFLHHAACHAVSTDCKEHQPLPERSFDYTDKLMTVVTAYLSDGYVSEKLAATLLETKVRTMTRRLATHGVTYGKLIDDVRFQVAKKRLCNPDMRIIDVAQSVGFRDQANFTRMFRRIGGVTPGQFRRLYQSEEPGPGQH